MHPARVHDETFWGTKNSDIPCRTFNDSLHFYKDLGNESWSLIVDMYLNSITKIFLIIEVKSIRAHLSVISMVFQVNLYSGALFIQQALQWNLYLSVFALLALTCICTIGKYSFSHPEKIS